MGVQKSNAGRVIKTSVELEREAEWVYTMPVNPCYFTQEKIKYKRSQWVSRQLNEQSSLLAK